MKRLVLCCLLFLAALYAETVFSSPLPYYINGRYGYINDKGGVVIQPIFQSASKFTKSVAIVKINNQWSFINEKGVFLTAVFFDEVKAFKNDAARIRLGDYWGFISPSGTFIIPPILDSAEDFTSDGQAQVVINGTEAYVDLNGNFIFAGTN